ncbi:MAG: hypothetical protein Q4C64_00590 [Erysipelotrichia bacterium]|nr:hypothetical protein [Erysipelotrichia bacterium]
MQRTFNEDINFIFETFIKNNYQIYLIGGCVRDMLLNKTPNDYDFTTDALPTEICQLFAEYEIITNGINEGSVTLVLNNQEYEITTFRLDGQYINHRRPKEVIFTDNLKDDLKRRDFTVNALACNCQGEITDCYNGLNDLKNKLIRTIGNSDRRFDEDALRILRALRFCAQLNFSLEENTADSINKNKHLLHFLSKERITEEFSKLLVAISHPKILLDYRSVFEELFPQLNDISTNQYQNNCEALVQSKHNLTIRLALFFHNCQGIKEVKNLSLNKNLTNEIDFLINNQFLLIPLTEVELKKFLSIFSFKAIKQLIKFQYLLNYIDPIQFSLYQNALSKIEQQNQCYQLKQLAVNGNDLLHFGYKPVEIGSLMNNLLNLVIENKLPNKRDELLKFIKKSEK